MRLCEGMKIRHGVFTYDREFAEEIIDMLVNDKEISKCVKGESHIEVYLEDGTNYVWVKPIANSRGFKCSQATIDLATCSLEAIQHVIMPSCIFADKEDFTLVDSTHKDCIQFQHKLSELVDRLTKAMWILGDMDVNCNSLFGEESPLVKIEFSEDKICLIGGDLI